MRISGEKTMRTSGQGGERTSGLALPPCPVCQTPGVPGEEFCPECGFLVGSIPGEMPEGSQVRPLPKLVDETGREFVLRTGENTVGRESADISINNKTVSRRHAVLRVSENNTVIVEDTSSTNGTKCGGIRVSPGQPVALSDGVIVQFGEIKLTTVIPPAAATPAASTPSAQPAYPAIESSGEAPPPPPLALMPPIQSIADSSAAARLVGADGAVYPLGDGAISFGRRNSNTYVLSEDSYVSGAHAVITQENGRFYLMDLGSTNGSRLNGRRITANHQEPLSDGDEILLGQTPFTFHLNDGPTV